jgi:hypothetical protein
VSRDCILLHCLCNLHDLQFFSPVILRSASSSTAAFSCSSLDFLPGSSNSSSSSSSQQHRTEGHHPIGQRHAKQPRCRIISTCDKSTTFKTHNKGRSLKHLNLLDLSQAVQPLLRVRSVVQIGQGQPQVSDVNVTSFKRSNSMQLSKLTACVTASA